MSQLPPHFSATIVLDGRFQNISLNTTVFVYLTTESVSLIILHQAILFADKHVWRIKKTNMTYPRLSNEMNWNLGFLFQKEN